MDQTKPKTLAPRGEVDWDATLAKVKKDGWIVELEVDPFICLEAPWVDAERCLEQMGERVMALLRADVRAFRGHRAERKDFERRTREAYAQEMKRN